MQQLGDYPGTPSVRNRLLSAPALAAVSLGVSYRSILDSFPGIPRMEGIFRDARHMEYKGLEASAEHSSSVSVFLSISAFASQGSLLSIPPLYLQVLPAPKLCLRLTVSLCGGRGVARANEIVTRLETEAQ